MIRNPLLFACVLALVAAPAAAQPSASSAQAWRTDVPCTAGRRPALVMADTAVAAEVPGCIRASCITLPGGRRVCSCTGDTTIVFRVEEGGRVLQEWPANRSWMTLVRVLQGDLDGDGHAETIVNEAVDFGNGLGVRYDEVHIIDGRDPTRAPVVLALEDYEPEGSFVRPASGGECRLIVTRWQEMREPRRGRGTYFIGQWMRYRDGRLEHDPDRPVVARRLLNSFENARGSTPGEPFAHLRHRDAQAWTANPAGSLPPLAGRQAAVIRGLHGARRSSLEVALASGGTERYRIGLDFGADFSQTTTWLVDGATGRPYPRAYLPADGDWLTGARVTLARYDDGGGERVNLLIIGPQPRPQD